jgi:hypothetical protein
MTANVTVDGFLGAYWPGLSTELAALDAALLTALKAIATSELSYFSTDELTDDDKTQIQALIICREAAGMPAINGWEQGRYLTSLKIGNRTYQKKDDKDRWIGEIERKLAKCRDTRGDAKKIADYSVLVRRPGAHVAPSLDNVETRGLETQAYEYIPEELRVTEIDDDED